MQKYEIWSSRWNEPHSKDHFCREADREAIEKFEKNYDKNPSFAWHHCILFRINEDGHLKKIREVRAFKDE